MPTVGANIKKLRKHTKLNQKDFAEKIGVSQSYISDLENNRKNVSIKVAIGICRKFNISVNHIINDDLDI